jgi:hypothetical protein
VDLQERKFQELPLGTRFKYNPTGSTWVVLQRYGCGLIAEWNGPNGWNAGQSICSAEDSPERCADLTVYALND